VITRLEKPTMSNLTHPSLRMRLDFSPLKKVAKCRQRLKTIADDLSNRQHAHRENPTWKWNRRRRSVAAAPPKRLAQIGLCHSSLESALVTRARVRAANMVDAPELHRRPEPESANNNRMASIDQSPISKPRSRRTEITYRVSALRHHTTPIMRSTR
jgi:hypothetical protein